jgi:hypothetical protein
MSFRVIIVLRLAGLGSKRGTLVLFFHHSSLSHSNSPNEIQIKYWGNLRPVYTNNSIFVAPRRATHVVLYIHRSLRGIYTNNENPVALRQLETILFFSRDVAQQGFHCSCECPSKAYSTFCVTQNYFMGHWYVLSLVHNQSIKATVHST